MKKIFPCILILLCGLSAGKAREFDLILRGGTVVDGTGATRRVTDVGVIGDTIAAVGNLAGSTAKREISAAGLIVAPGFIDMHCHFEEGPGLLSNDVRRRAAQNFITQGITLGVTNQDGGQPESLPAERRFMMKNGIGVNVVLLNGHNYLRAMVMGKDQERPATKDEIAKMKAILQRGLESEGSFGLSLGLEYYSGRYSTPDEVVELSKTLAPYGGIWIAHQRSQGNAPMWYNPSVDKNIVPPTLADSLRESIRVADETGVTTIVTHMKSWGPGYRGEAAKWVAMLQACRDRGGRIFMDLYSFNSTASDGQFVLLPPWSLGGSTTRGEKPVDYAAILRTTLGVPGKRADLKLDVENQVALKGGPENVLILDCPDRDYVGKSLAEVMAIRKMDVTDLAIALQLEGDKNQPGGAKMRALSLDEHDIETYYAQPWAAMDTDGWIVLPEEAVGWKKYILTNRRLFGTFPRRIAYYSQERKVDSLEVAIRKCSGLGAEILNIQDRGKILPGMKADITVFDLAKLRDNTSVEEPSVYASGMIYVFVNGVAAIDNERRMLTLSGRVLDPVGRPAIESAEGLK